MLALRISRSFLALKPVFEKLVNYSSKFIVFEHTDASRIHIHALIQDCKPSTDTLKNWIKAQVGKVDKTDWSFVSKDVNEGFITYMAKGVLEPVMVHNYDAELVNKYKHQWEDRPKVYKQQRITYVVKESQKERKARQEDMIKEIIERLPEHFTTKDLVSLIIQVVVKEHKNICGRFKLRDYFDTIYAHVNTRSFVENIHHMCTKDFSEY